MYVRVLMFGNKRQQLAIVGGVFQKYTALNFQAINRDFCSDAFSTVFIAVSLLSRVFGDGEQVSSKYRSFHLPPSSCGTSVIFTLPGK